MEYDANRTAILESYGLHVIRFTNDEIYNQFDEVCAKIEHEIDKRVSVVEERETKEEEEEERETP